MRITYLLWGTGLFGGHRSVFEHVNGLINRGHDVKVVTHFGEDPDWFPLKTRVIKLPPFSENFPESDVLVATYWPTIYEAERLKAAKKFMFIQGYDPMFYTDSERHEMCKNAFRSSLKPIVVSRWLQERLKAEFDRDSIYITYGIDTSVFKLKNQRKLNESRNVLNILYVVTDYGSWRGISELLEAFKIVKRRWSGLNMFKSNKKRIKITFVSTKKYPPPGAKGKIDEFISYPSQERLIDIYNKSDIFVHSSRCEGFGLPPLEAMACGCAVAASDSFGVREYARPNINCLLVPQRDSVELAKAIDTLIENDQLRMRFAKNGVETAKEFNWERIIDLLEETFCKKE